MRVVGQAFIGANTVHNARGKSATAKNVVHDYDREVVRVIAHDAGQHHSHTALIDIFIDNIDAGLGEDRVGRNGRRGGTVKGPVREQVLEFANHAVPIEIAAGGHDKVSRLEPLLMEGFQVRP